MQDAQSREWLGLTDAPIPVGDVYAWCLSPECGAVVLFSGTVRDHAEGRDNVTELEYQAYDEMVLPQFVEIAAEARRRVDGIGRIAIIHRVGTLGVGEASVVTAVSAGHRDQAFAAGRFLIDTLKASVPIWKKETWEGGVDWGTGATPLTPVDSPSDSPDDSPVDFGVGSTTDGTVAT